MAAGGRAAARPAGVTLPFTTHRVIISSFFTLLFIASVVSILSSGSTASHRRRFLLALDPDPLPSVDLLRHQASGQAALATAYAAYARRLKLEHSVQLQLFSSLSSSLGALLSRLDPESITDEEVLRPIEREAKERIKLVRQLVSELKEPFDLQLKIQKLRDTIFAVREQLHRADRLRSLSYTIAAGSTPKSLHCLAMRLLADRVSNPDAFPRAPSFLDDYRSDLSLIHYAIFSDNVIAVSVVVNSAVRNAADPRRHVFHVVSDGIYIAAMRVWFARRPPPGGARVDLRSINDFPSLNSSGGWGDLPALDGLRFYLPDMFPELRRIILLEDDVVVQRDLSALWKVDLNGNVNGAVETCFGGFRRFSRYLNFSHPVVKQSFSPSACAWSYGVNVFDLDSWRRERCTNRFQEYLTLNNNGSLWSSGSALPAGLMTFYTTTKSLDSWWHVMGLGFNPGVSMDEIHSAAVIHFSGNMKPWLDVALNQYKHLWTKYVDNEMEFLPLCNFGM